MCDCYYHKCQNPTCDEELPVHIGDSSTPRENLEIYCARHLPRKLEDFPGVVWKWTGYEDHHKRHIPRGMKMGIIVLDKSKVEEWGQGWDYYKDHIYPNSCFCEKIKDWGVTMKTWRLDEWNAHFAKDDFKLISMTKEDVREAIKFLRDNNYPKPEDCPWESCPNLRPTCKVGICQIAVGMCGDF